MKSRTIFWVALSAAIWLGAHVECFGASPVDEVFEMPLTETRDVITEWLTGEGFQLFDNAQSRQVMDLVAEKASLQLYIAARPHSPLATRVSIRTRRGGHYALALKNHLNAYINLPNIPVQTPRVVPTSVRRYIESVVCIYAAGAHREVQLTGFIVDRRGFILCTAHDLEHNQRVSIVLHNGAEVGGVVELVHHQADVALIKSDTVLNASVNLRMGRFMLNSGDQLFGITCSDGGRARIEPGIIDGPPRRVEGMHLWQARMHIDHGSSGSPVFDSQGRLAAMVKGRFRGTDAIGFLIPFETLLNVLGRY